LHQFWQQEGYPLPPCLWPFQHQKRSPTFPLICVCFNARSPLPPSFVSISTQASFPLICVLFHTWRGGSPFSHYVYVMFRGCFDPPKWVQVATGLQPHEYRAGWLQVQVMLKLPVGHPGIP
jgi:hypothetical protein